MILFENYYKANPIKINKNSYLNKIDSEIQNEKISGEKELNKEIKNEKKEEGESLITLNSEEE